MTGFAIAIASKTFAGSCPIDSNVSFLRDDNHICNRQKLRNARKGDLFKASESFAQLLVCSTSHAKRCQDFCSFNPTKNNLTLSRLINVTE